MEAKRLTSFSNAAHKSSSKQASFQYFLHRFNSLCFCMCIKSFSRWERDNYHLRFALLTDMSNQCVIKDYFQIAKFKERVLIFFSSTAHQQVQDIYISDQLLNLSEKKFFLTEHYLRHEKTRKFVLPQLSILDILS